MKNLSLGLILICGLNTVNSYATDYVSNASASWGLSSTWLPNDGVNFPVAGDNVTILTGHNISMLGTRACDNLTIDAGGILTKTSLYVLTIHRDFTINGTFSGAGTGAVNFDTNDKTISGTGTVSNNVNWNFNRNITIPAGAVISKPNSFTIASGFTLTNNGSITSTNNSLVLNGTWINAAGSTVNVAAAMTGSGALNASASPNTVIYAGAGNYNIKAPAFNTYHHLTLQGGGTKTDAAGLLTINGTVTIAASTTFATGTNLVIMASDATGTARIGNSAGTITGTNWIVQRFIPAVAFSATHWNDVSTPINGNNIADWDDELFMSMAAGCPDGMAAGWSSVYFWDGPTQTWAAAVSNCLEPLVVTRGYELWLATTLSSLSATTMDSRGTPNFGDQIASLAGAGIGNWSLIGNPYAAGIRWSDVYASATNLSNSFSVYDESINNYAVWDGATGTGKLAGSGGNMSAHQGFWVQNSNASAPTLTFQEADKFDIDRPLVREMEPTNVLKMRLYSDNRKNACESVIKIQDDASEFFDGNTDFGYLKSRDTLTPDLTPVTADNRKVRIKAVPVKPSLSVPLAATFGAKGEYSINFSGMNRIFKYNRIILEDTETGIFFPINSDPAAFNKYDNGSQADRTYSFTQNDISKERKFILHFSNVRNTSGMENMADVFSAGEGVSVDFYFDEATTTTVEIYNTLGQEVFTENVKAGTERMLFPLSKNNQLYFVKITAAEGTVTKKIFH